MGVAWKQCQNHVKAGKTIQSNLTLLHSISKCCLTWASCPSHSFSKKAAWPCMRRSPKGWFQERHYFVVSVTVIKEVMWEPHHGSNCYRCDSVPSCSSTEAPSVRVAQSSQTWPCLKWTWGVNLDGFVLAIWADFCFFHRLTKAYIFESLTKNCGSLESNCT